MTENIAEPEQQFLRDFRAAPTREDRISQMALDSFTSCRRIFVRSEFHDRLRSFWIEITKAALAAKAGGSLENYEAALHRVEVQVREAWTYACSPKGFAHVDSAADQIEKWRPELGGYGHGTGAEMDTLQRPPFAAMLESGITGVNVETIETRKGTITRAMIREHCLNPGGLPTEKRLNDIRERIGAPRVSTAGRGVAERMPDGSFAYPVN